MNFWSTFANGKKLNPAQTRILYCNAGFVVALVQSVTVCGRCLFRQGGIGGIQGAHRGDNAVLQDSAGRDYLSS